MAKKKESQKITIDGKEYIVDDLSENAKKQLININFVDSQLQQLNNEWAIADTARIGYERPQKELNILICKGNMMEQKVKIDDKEYSIADLSENAKSTLVTLQFAIKRKENMLAILQRAKLGYVEEIKRNVR